MILEEVIGDLFSAPPNVSLAHCVSADLAMRKGIAKTFKQAFGRVSELKGQKAGVGGIATGCLRKKFLSEFPSKYI